MAFPTPDQKSERIARLLVEEIVPYFGVPEAVLSDRGTNLLSFLMKDICQLLGIKKLNTTASHPQCNGVVERFNQTLKSMLRKQAAKFGMQWDKYLSGVLWAYRNTPHSTTGEKPSLGLTVDLPQKLLYCLPKHVELPMPMYLIIESRWYYHCHLLGAWRLRPVKKLSDDTKYNMTKQQELQSSELAIGR